MYFVELSTINFYLFNQVTKRKASLPRVQRYYVFMISEKTQSSTQKHNVETTDWFGKLINLNRDAITWHGILITLLIVYLKMFM